MAIRGAGQTIILCTVSHRGAAGHRLREASQGPRFAKWQLRGVTDLHVDKSLESCSEYATAALGQSRHLIRKDRVGKSPRADPSCGYVRGDAGST